MIANKMSYPSTTLLLLPAFSRVFKVKFCRCLVWMCITHRSMRSTGRFPSRAFGAPCCRPLNTAPLMDLPKSPYKKEIRLSSFPPGRLGQVHFRSFLRLENVAPVRNSVPLTWNVFPSFYLPTPFYKMI